MDRQEWPAERFEEDRGHLRAVAYRMLGSVGEAEDAAQEFGNLWWMEKGKEFLAQVFNQDDVVLPTAASTDVECGPSLSTSGPCVISLAA